MEEYIFLSKITKRPWSLKFWMDLTQFTSDPKPKMSRSSTTSGRRMKKINGSFHTSEYCKSNQLAIGTM
ncbi:MAG: hypothetical protein QXW79_00680 [Thermoplasmata archaeon]